MDFLTNLRQQILAIWQRSNPAYRVALVASTVLSIATIAGVGWWASRPQYMPLANNLTPAQAAKVVEKLEGANIPFKKSFSASVISVPEHQFADATVAVRDLGVVGDLPAPEQSIGDSVFVDPDMKRELVRAAKERALEASIMRLKSVSFADVHIAMPDPEPFARDRREPKATVLVGVQRGEVFSPEQAITIATLVASSVEGLVTDNVSVTDTEGRTIHPSPQLADGGLTRQYQYKQRLEAELAAKAETMLAEMLGPGRAIVRVNADLDFTETTRTQRKYDTEGSAKEQEDILTEEEQGTVDVAQGAAGTAANLSTQANRNSLPRSKKTEKITTTWKNGEIVDTVQEYGGSIKRLTVSALVDLPDPDPNAAPNTPVIDKLQVENIIRNALGFLDERNDKIEVVPTELVGIETGVTTLVDTLNRWDFYNNLVRNASLGLAAVVALILGLLLIRKLQPVTALRGAADRVPEADRTSMVAELSAQAKENPELVSKIVAAWLNASNTVPIRPEMAEREPLQRKAA
jgi:flagellar M-ring protein FliF